jgi:asparagine synthase (glutamine-hydrolysing)
MCGICGIIHFDNQPVQEGPIRKMMAKMKHRGPDNEGVFIENNIGLGFVRLSIIDLSPAGNQPMISDDNRFVIVYNGEIFNYIELREQLIFKGYIFRTKTDTEVLLASYKEWGEECLHKFNGMWAFVIYDRVSRSIFASRDRYGIKPFYYFWDNMQLIFASEIPPLLTIIKNKPTVNNQAIFDFLVFNRTDHLNTTFFNGIYKLQHGHKFKLDINSAPLNLIEENKKWYDLRKEVSRHSGFSNPGELYQLLTDSIGLRLRSDVPVGVCLSGGIDSSTIVSILVKEFKKNDLNTFSAVYSKGQFGDETEFITEYSSIIKNMFFTSPSAESLNYEMNDFIKAHAEPFPETGVYAQYKVMQLAANNVVVTLDGQGSDELLAGYHYFFGYFFKELLLRGSIYKLVREMNWYVRNYKDFYAFKTFAYFLLPGFLRTYLRASENGYLNKDFIHTYRGKNTIADDLYGSGTLTDALLDHFEYKLEHLLKWEDRNSMRFSLEARVPFLDHRLVEKILSLPSEKVIKNGITKYIFRQAIKGTVPEKILTRKDKIGFGTPQDEWFKTHLWQKKVSELLESDSFRQRGYINSDKAIKSYKDHISGKTDISKEIWKWINLETWFREFYH